jgi:hypothetical protein
MSGEENKGTLRPAHGEGCFDQGSADVSNEVTTPDYVMHPFGFPEKQRGAGQGPGPRSVPR